MVFIISLFSLAHACVHFYGDVSNQDESKALNWLTIILAERCRWSGVWLKDKPQGMNCNPGFATDRKSVV